MWLVLHHNYNEVYDAVCCYKSKEDAVQMYDSLVKATVAELDDLTPERVAKLNEFVKASREKLNFDLFEYNGDFERVHIVEFKDKEIYYV